MRIGRQEQKKIVVAIIMQRPANAGEKNNRGKAYKEGQSVRETFETVDVYDATPEQVQEVILKALMGASGVSKK